MLGLQREELVFESLNARRALLFGLMSGKGRQRDER
jgi:hypothetical protein